MDIFHGIGVGQNAAVGPVRTMRPAPTIPDEEPVTPSSAEDLRRALEGVQEDLLHKAQDASGEAQLVLEVTAQMAGDQQLLKSSLECIAQGLGPAHAIDQVMEEYCQQLVAAGGYLAERVTDLRSVKDRVIARLLGAAPPGISDLPPFAVIVAKDISAADIAAIDLAEVGALVTEEGGPTGHTAIIASQMGVPCVVGAPGVTALVDDALVMVDAAAGQVVLDPTADMVARVQERREALRALATDTSTGTTSDGVAIKLLANVGSLADVEDLPATSEGIGLFRTEFLYMDRETEPSVAEQTELYQQVLEQAPGNDLVIRTLDAGSDKPLAFAAGKPEANPALGVRGYRLVRSNEAIVDRQLEAIGAAAKATGRQPRVMAPMIATVDEAAEFTSRARSHGLTQVGVMVEVPSVAIRAEQVLREVDFVSIGTNDLSQYTMAADRLEGGFSQLLDPLQPAVLELIGRVGAAGESLGKSVGVCGAAAADPVAALVLVGLGVTSLSAPVAAQSLVRFALKYHTLTQCQHFAQVALESRDPASAREEIAALLDAEVAAVLAV